MAHRWTPWLLGIAVLLSGVVKAQPSSGARGVRLSWARGAGADGCLDGGTLERDVTRRLGYDPFAGEARQWLEGIVVSQSGQYRAELFERDPQGKSLGHREIVDDTASCAQLGEAISLAVALIIDPNAELRPLEAPAPAAAPSERPLVTAPVVTLAAPTTAPAVAPCRNACAPVPPTAAPVTESSPKLVAAAPPSTAPVVDRDGTNPSFWLLPGLRWGLFPEVTPSVEFAVQGSLASSGPWTYRLGMVYLPENKVESDAATLSYGLTAGFGQLCAVSRGGLRAFGCMGLEGGALHTVVHDPDPDDPGDRPWLAGRIELGGEVTLVGPVSLQLRLLGAVPLLPWTFHVTVDGSRQQLYSQQSFEPGASFGLGMRFF